MKVSAFDAKRGELHALKKPEIIAMKMQLKNQEYKLKL